jgi:hypothetical protein
MLYPNPVHNVVKFVNPDIKNINSIRIFSSAGILIYADTNMNVPAEEAQIDISSLAAGSYLMLIKSGAVEYHANFVKN